MSKTLFEKIWENMCDTLPTERSSFISTGFRSCHEVTSPQGFSQGYVPVAKAFRPE